MRFVRAIPVIFTQLDDLIGRASPLASVNTAGIALTREERASLYRTIGMRSPTSGNVFVKADAATKRETAGRGIKGLRGYYGGFRILAEEEQ